MIQLLYISTATGEVDDAALDAIGAVASDRNAADGITGLLCFNGRNFMQLVEGERAAIDGLVSKLKADSRHNGLVLLHDAPATNRAFPDWSMRTEWVSADADKRSLTLEALLPESVDPALRKLMLAFGELA